MSMTRKSYWLLVAVLLITAPLVLNAQDRRNFWALNNTGKTIDQLYVSPHENSKWGGDVLGSSTLANGMGTVISFRSVAYSSCEMDFKLVFSDGSKATYLQGRNVCSLHAVQFNADNSIGLVNP